MSDEHDEVKVITTCVFWDLEDFVLPDNLNPFYVYRNLLSALKSKGFIGRLKIWFYYGGNLDFTDEIVDKYEELHTFFFRLEGDIYEKATRIMRDALLWSVDNPVRDDIPEQANLFIISNKFSGEETKELLSYLQALESRKYNILLALTEPESCEALLPRVSLEWLWHRILGAGDDLEDDVDNTTLCNSCNKEEELKAANIKILEMEKAQAEQAKVLAQQAKELEYYKNIVFNQFPNLVLPTNPPARDDN
ncbi:hypothetical protein ISN45_Aa05g031220 [Arabidopsis thaliana x Arabidopsis arenosa]|uniref:NYN domain-containing protein n=1 Tax=Arabidopsis thaliana x Arabidopsis arenosa TaxID=1240361 RepID=A0A8T1ZST5_9BRAS|nr:hypothetical protein ISN45_Aa05g031220 [Arabidopsis thaliana x Arabidopsis arenosa]